MAKYPQGVSSYIPTFQAYEPDFTTMGKLLSIKQDRYDQNWKKLNNIYSSLYFSETSHPQSQRVKDQLRHEIDFNLRRISGLDLSLDQNVQAAQQVFQPFYQNKNLMYDMAATRNFKAAKNQALNFKTSTKPDEQNLYWQDGLLELDYKLKEFQEMPYDQIRNSGLAQVRYTPFVDIGKMAEDMAKEFGDKTIPSTSADGKYEITTTNGPALLMQPLSQLFQFRMGNDPRVQDMYRTQAYVDRKNWALSNAGSYGGDVQAAERAYLENEFKVLQGGIKRTNQKLSNNEKSFNEMQTILQTALDNGTAPAGAEEALRSVLTNKDMIQSILNASNKEKDLVTEGTSNGNTSTGNKVIFDGDIDLLRSKVDVLRANSLMMQDFNKAAYIYSQRNMKVERKPNEYALAEFKENLRAKNERQLNRDKFMVESGVAVYDEFGNIHEIKARNDWQSEGPVGGVTAGETNLRDFAQTQLSSEWAQVKPGMTQGLDIATVIGLEGSTVGERVSKVLNRGRYTNKEGQSVDKNNRPLTLTIVKNAIQNTSTQQEFEKETGLDLGDLYTLNSELLDLMNTDETVSTLIDSKFQTAVDKEKVTNWKKQSIKDNLLLEGINAEKAWLAEATQNLLTKSYQSDGPLGNAQYAVNHQTGDLLSKEQYYNNAIREIEKNGQGWAADWIRKYLADEKRYARREQQLDESAAQQWEKGNYLGWFKDQFESTFNTYKDLDDFILPEEVVGEIIKDYSIADYDDVAEAWNLEWTKSRNFKKAPPSSFGTGSGISSMVSSTIVTPSNQGVRPTQDFYGHIGKVGIYDDYRNVKNKVNIGPELSNASPVMFSAVGTGLNVLDDDVNTLDHQRYAKLIWDAHNDRDLYDKGQGFTVKVSPTTGISGNKAAYTIMPGKEVLDELIPKGDDDSEINYDKIREDLLMNGATVISDRVNFDSYAFEASTTNPIEASLKRQADVSNSGIVEKNIDISPGYGIDFTYDKPDNQYSVNHRFKAFDLETYLSSGQLINMDVNLELQNGETLYHQFENYLSSTMPVTEAAARERVNLVRALRQRNPGITDAQIREIFRTYNFQYNLQ